MIPTQPGHLTAFEHQPLPIGAGGLTAGEAEYLMAIGERRRGFCTREPGSVRLAQYCGVVSIGGRMLEVLPKVGESAEPGQSRGILLRLLRHSGELPILHRLPSTQELARAPLLEVFIGAFFDTALDVVRGGLLRQYQAHEDDLLVVRGRILTERQFSVNAGRPDRVACRYDELTADNQWNQALKRGIRAVRPWIQSSELERRWLELAAIFDDVADVEIDVATLDRFVMHRQASRYAAAVMWVRWILLLVSPSLRAGGKAAPGLLFDMNVLFERAVGSILRGRGRTMGLNVRLQDIDRRFAAVIGTTRAAVSLRPDIVVCSESGTIAVGDTKWKRLAGNQAGDLIPDVADVYQMFAYAAAYGCERLALIYPWHLGLMSARGTSLRLPELAGRSPELSIVCLDVEDDAMPIMTGRVWDAPAAQFATSG